jgi:transposase
MGRYDLTDFEWEAIEPHLQPMAEGECLGSADGRNHKGLRRRDVR